MATKKAENTRSERPKKSAAGTSLVLRVCREDLTAFGGFQWPSKVGATVSAPDWDKSNECGNGLHGWLYGQGELCVDFWSEENAKWLVLEVITADIVMLGGKCKFPSAKVRFVGDKNSAVEYLIKHEPLAATVAVIGATHAVGNNQLVAVGALGTATAGDRGTATAGDIGTATAGYRGTATAGDRGTATAGDSGTISIIYWCTKAEKYKVKIGYIGEDGLKPNVAYRLDENHKFVESV